MERLAHLETLSRSRPLTAEETAELARLIKAERYARRWIEQDGARKRRERYANDPAFRARVLAENERSRLRRLGRL